MHLKKAGVENLNELRIGPISKLYEAQTKKLVLDGFLERFGFIDSSLNPDLNSMCDTYGRAGHHFLIGQIQDEIIVTGWTYSGNVGNVESCPDVCEARLPKKRSC